MEGVQLATSQSNSTHGVRFDAFYYDDKCSPDEARKIALEIVHEGISFVIGHLCEEAAVAASRVYVESDVLFITLGVRHPSLTESDGKYVFRLATSTDQIGTWTARLFSTEQSDLDSIVLVYPDNPVDNAIAEAFMSEWRSLSNTAHSFQLVSPHRDPFDDLGDTINKLVELNPDAVYISSFQPDKLSAFINAATQSSQTMQILSTGYLGSLSARRGRQKYL